VEAAPANRHHGRHARLVADELGAARSKAPAAWRLVDIEVNKLNSQPAP
jgi:hypothetical protein